MDSYTHHRFSGNNFVNEIHRMLWLGALGHNDPLQKDPSSEIWQREDRTEIEAQRHLSSGLLTRKFTVMNGGESILTYTTWGDLSPEGKRHFDQLGLGYVQAGTRRTTIVSMDKERSD